MAEKVLLFPTPEDISAVQTAVSILVRTGRGTTRQLMLKVIRTVLDKYGIRRFSLPEYVVEATKEPGWATVRGKHSIAGRLCPGCGADIYRWPGPVKILGIMEGFKADTVTYGCTCGAVFTKVEPV